MNLNFNLIINIIIIIITSLHKIERFSFECRKVIGFALSTRCDWLKRFAPPFHPIRSKTKANCDALARFSRALRQPHVITSSFDWFRVITLVLVLRHSNENHSNMHVMLIFLAIFFFSHQRKNSLIEKESKKNKCCQQQLQFTNSNVTCSIIMTSRS